MPHFYFLHFTFSPYPGRFQDRQSPFIKLKYERSHTISICTRYDSVIVLLKVVYKNLTSEKVCSNYLGFYSNELDHFAQWKQGSATSEEWKNMMAWRAFSKSRFSEPAEDKAYSMNQLALDKRIRVLLAIILYRADVTERSVIFGLLFRALETSWNQS